LKRYVPGEQIVIGWMDWWMNGYRAQAASDTMNIVMGAQDESLASKYVEQVAANLGDLGPSFKKEAGQILKQRFTPIKPEASSSESKAH
jgi:hypothetical protein